jgi:hypothetical protein
MVRVSKITTDGNSPLVAMLADIYLIMCFTVPSGEEKPSEKDARQCLFARITRLPPDARR